MQTILQKLIAREKLNQKEIDRALNLALEETNPIQIGAFLVLLEAKGVSADELFWVLEFLEAHEESLQTQTPVLDIVGTGGDGADTFNISTGAAILAAACGVKVAKHGGRRVSSKCGSIDLLEALGIEFDLKKEDYLTCLDEVGLVFMPATQFHETWRALREIRSQLKVRTLLNLVGPLLNPAKAHYQIVGVYKEELLGLMSEVLFKQKKKALVVCSHGVDELTSASTALIKIVNEKGIQTKKIDPQDFGIQKSHLADLKGGDVLFNAEKLTEVLKGKEGPWAETLILNAACALFIRGKVSTIQEGVDLARSQLKKGAAYEKLNQCIKITQKLKRN